MFQAASRDDRIAAETIEFAAQRIAQAFGTLLNVLNPEACVIGGGVSEAGEALLEPVRRHLPDYAWPLVHRGVDVVSAALRNDAGVLGAAAGALDKLQEATDGERGEGMSGAESGRGTTGGEG